jgi:hypothetical protein
LMMIKLFKNCCIVTQPRKTNNETILSNPCHILTAFFTYPPPSFTDYAIQCLYRPQNPLLVFLGFSPYSTPCTFITSHHSWLLGFTHSIYMVFQSIPVCSITFNYFYLILVKNRDSSVSIVTRTRTGRPVFRFPAEEMKGLFLFATAFRLVLKPNHPPIQLLQGLFPQR